MPKKKSRYEFISKRLLTKMKEQLENFFTAMPSNLRTELIQKYGLPTVFKSIAWYLWNNEALCAKVLGMTYQSFFDSMKTEKMKKCIQELKPMFDTSDIYRWAELHIVGMIELSGTKKLQALKLLKDFKYVEFLDKTGGINTKKGGNFTPPTIDLEDGA